MTTPVPADAEAIVVGYLNAELTEPVSTEMPTNPTFPLVTIRRVGGAGDEPRWLDRPRIQVEAWADTKQEARTSAATAWAKLADMEGAYNYGAGAVGVVNGVQLASGLTWVPDENGKPRYLFVATVSLHP